MKNLYPLLRSLVMLLVFSMAANADDTTSPATVIVEDFHTILLDVMQNAETLGFKGRYEKLAPVIQERFDTPLISKVILSRYWNELGDEQRENFIQLFNHLSISTYASRFNSYSGETFKTLGIDELNKGRILVRTELVKKNEKPVKFIKKTETGI
jgi:phospholipid transport system substrate-binding protein